MTNYSKIEDSLLVKLVNKYGTDKWEQIAKKFKVRTERSLRIRWAKLRSRLFMVNQEWTLSDDMYLFALIINAIDKNLDTIVSKHSKCSMKEKIIHRVQEFTNTILNSITNNSERGNSLPASEERKNGPIDTSAAFRRRRSVKASKKEDDGTDSYKPSSKLQGVSLKKQNTRSGQQIEGLSVGEEQNEHMIWDIPVLISDLRDWGLTAEKPKRKRRNRKHSNDDKTSNKKETVELKFLNEDSKRDDFSKPRTRRARKRENEESKIDIKKPIEEKSVGLDELLGQTWCVQSPQPFTDFFAINDESKRVEIQSKRSSTKPTRSKSLVSKRVKNEKVEKKSKPKRKLKKEVVFPSNPIKESEFLRKISIRKPMKKEE